MGKKFNEVTAQPSTPNDADLVLWGDVTTGLAYRMTFTQLKAKLDGMSGATTLTAPTLSVSSIDADTLRLTIGTVANETSIEIQRSNDGTTGWSTINTAAANTTTYDDNGLAASTTRHYRVRAVGDGVTYLTSAWSSVASATTAAGGLVEVNFDTKTAGLTESPANYWDSGASATDYGVSALTMAGDGTFQAEVDGTGNAPICVGTTSTNQYWVDGSYFLLEKATIFVYLGNYYYAEEGAGNVDTGTAASVGHLYRLRRSGTSLIGEYSTNSGGSWSTLRSFTTTASGTLYLKTSVLTAGDGIKNPQASGVA
jgi:hypothetical protein